MLEAWLLKVCVCVCRYVDCTYDRKQHRKWLGTVVNPPDRCFPSCSIVILSICCIIHCKIIFAYQFHGF